MFGAAIRVQPDGKIVAAGGASAGGGSDACLVRLNGNDGSLDSGFGSNGVKVVSLGSGNVDFVNALAIQPDGKFVIGGGTVNGGANTDSFVAWFGTNALLDLGFASGFVPHEIGDTIDAIDQLQGIALDADGRRLGVLLQRPQQPGEGHRRSVLAVGSPASGGPRFGRRQPDDEPPATSKRDPRQQGMHRHRRLTDR